MDQQTFLQEIDWIYEQFKQSQKQEMDYGRFEWRLAQLTLHYKTGDSFPWRNVE